MIKEDKVIVGICLPRNLKETIDKARGDIPRSTYISKLLDQIHQNEKENIRKIEEIEDKQPNKSGCRLRPNSASSSNSHLQTSTMDLIKNEQE